MFYLPNTPLWLRMIFPSGVMWKGDPGNNTVYLTFDDGPEPEATPFVLDQLAKYNFKATFFCIGDNVAKYPEIFEKVKAAGHRVGNHTMHHPNGWTTKDDSYVNEIMEAHQLIGSDLFRPPYGKITPGQAKRLREKELQMAGLGIGEHAANRGLAKESPAKEGSAIPEQNLDVNHQTSVHKSIGTSDRKIKNYRSQITDERFKIIMWSVIAGDFDEKIDGNTCYNHVVKYTKPGSIIVFHDSQKAFPRLKTALPKTLEWLVQQGFRMEVIK